MFCYFHLWWATHVCFTVWIIFYVSVPENGIDISMFLPFGMLKMHCYFSQSFIIKIRCTVQVKWSNALKSVATCHKSSFEEVRTVIAYSWHRFCWKKGTFFSNFCWFTRYEDFSIALLLYVIIQHFLYFYFYMNSTFCTLCSLTEISGFFSFQFVNSNYM